MTENCKTCKQKGPGSFQIGTIILGFYVLASTIYGTYTFINDIIQFFKYPQFSGLKKRSNVRIKLGVT